jgi:hypothetical protein
VTGRTDLRIVAAAALLFLALSLPGAGQPVTDDEIYEVRNAERLLAGEPIHLYIPPVYDLLLAGVIALGGSHEAMLRLPGWASWLLALALTVRLARRLGFDDGRTALAAAGVACLPAVTQGALLVHIDNTILVPAVLWIVERVLAWREGAGGAWLVLAVATALLVKFSTPVFVLAGLAAALLLVDGWARLRVFLGYAALGAALFALSWALLASWLSLDAWQPFDFAGRRVAAQGGGIGERLAMGARNGWIVVAWCTPFLIPAALLGAWRSCRRGDKPGLIAAAAGLACLAYLALTSINHGFPKYLLPAVPLWWLAAVSAVPLSRRLLVAAGVLAVAWAAVGHEPVYFLRVDVRRLLFDGAGLAAPLAEHAVLWLAPALLVGWWWHRRPGEGATIPTLLVALSLGGALATSGQQAVAPYQTNYSYGERGTRDLLSRLRERLQPADRVLATQDLLWYLDRRHEVLPDSVWTRDESIERRLRQPAARFLVASLPSHGRVALAALREGETGRYLRQHFRADSVGTFVVWERIAGG